MFDVRQPTPAQWGIGVDTHPDALLGWLPPTVSDKTAATTLRRVPERARFDIVFDQHAHPGHCLVYRALDLEGEPELLLHASREHAHTSGGLNSQSLAAQ